MELEGIYRKLSKVSAVLERFSLDYFLKGQPTVDRIDPRVISLCEPNSYISEQYKSLASRLFIEPTNLSGSNLVAITSAQPGDGKTTTASNLAATLSKHFKKKVLLIDADLRRPAVHRFFGLERGPGLSDLINGEAELEVLTAKPTKRGLYIIPAGAPVANPGQTLNCLAMKILLSRVRQEFDWVILDTSPALKTADIQSLGAYVSAVFFVARAGVTPRHMIEETLESLRDTPAYPKTCILTGSQRTFDYYSYWTNPNYRQAHYYRTYAGHELEQESASV